MTGPSDDLLQTWRTVLRNLDREALESLRTKVTDSDGPQSHLIREIDTELSLRPPESDDE